MQHRIRFVGIACVMAFLLAIGVVPATAAQQDICVSVNGVEIYRAGSATCDSDPGGSAVAVGDESYAEAYDSDFTDEYNSQGNTAVAVGYDSYTSVGDTSNGTGVASGDGSEADVNGSTYGGTNNTSVATGDGAYSDVEQSDNSTAIATGNESYAEAYDSSLTDEYDSTNNTSVS